MSRRWSSVSSTALAIVLAVVCAVVLTSTAEVSASQDKPAQLDKKEIEAKACGTGKEVDFNVETDKSTHPTPDPEAGKGLVYFVRSGLAGGAVQTKIAIDGKWIGANRGNNYFFVQLDPGEHYICSRAENHSVLPLVVEAGKTYYVAQQISMGFAKARNTVKLLDEKKGQQDLAKCHPSVSTEKK